MGYQRRATELSEYLTNNLRDSDLLFNLTGGTKPMSLAAFRLAQMRNAPIVYLQSEGGQSLLYRYEFNDGAPVLRERTIIEERLNIHEYLQAHGLGNHQQRQEVERFQQQVLDVLKPCVSEIISGVSIGVLDIDLTIRCDNQVGIAEVKSGKAAERKSGIDQLSTASQREFLGTYTKRFLILNRRLGTNNGELASAHGIRVIELLNSSATNIPDEDRAQLIKMVTKELGRKH